MNDHRSRTAAAPLRTCLALAGLLCLATGVESVEIPPPPEGFALSGDAERGAEIFAKRCALCHGPEGKGDGRLKTDPPAGDLTDPRRMDRRSDWEIYLVIRDGGEALGLSRKMLPWDQLPEQDLRDLAVFVRSLSAAEGGEER